MASRKYLIGASNLADGTVSWTSSDIRCALVVGYTPDIDHTTMSDIVAFEPGGGSGYLRTAITGRTVVIVSASDRIELRAGNTAFVALAGSAGTPEYAIVYWEGGGTDGTRELIGYVELPSAPTPNGQNYVIQWDATGLFRQTV